MQPTKMWQRVKIVRGEHKGKVGTVEFENPGVWSWVSLDGQERPVRIETVDLDLEEG